MISAVSALLNATNPAIAYSLTARQVIDRVNVALASADPVKMLTLRDELDRYNNFGTEQGEIGN
jgi:hypothetical protein